MEKVDDYKCPDCGTRGDDKSKLTQTKPLFTGYYKQYDNEPGGFWIEIHSCTKCKTLYCCENGF